MALSVGVGAPRPPLLQRVTPRQWFWIDVGLALLFFLVGLVTILGQGRHGGVFRNVGLHHPHSVALFMALCLASLPLPARRYYPLPVLVVVTCALAAVVVIGQNIADTPIVALPVYIVAARYERRVSLVALCAVGLAFLVALGIGEILRYASSSVMTDQIWSNVIVAVAAWFVGDSVRLPARLRRRVVAPGRRTATSGTGIGPALGRRGASSDSARAARHCGPQPQCDRDPIWRWRPRIGHATGGGAESSGRSGIDQSLGA